MATKMSWESKLIAWELGWVKREPMERVRFATGVGSRGENPSWRTMKAVMVEFLVLDEGQAQLLTEPLKETWRRWRIHIESLGACAKKLKSDLIFEETDISGATIYIPIFPTSFGDDDASEGDHKKSSLGWKVEGERVDVKFSVERLASFKQLVIHFPELDIWVQLEEMKGRLRDAIKNTAVDSKLRLERVSGIQPLAVKIVDGLGELLYYPPHMKRCDQCPDSAPGVFKSQRK